MLFENKTKERGQRDVGVYTRYVCTGISENKREPPEMGPQQDSPMAVPLYLVLF